MLIAMELYDLLHERLSCKTQHSSVAWFESSPIQLMMSTVRSCEACWHVERYGLSDEAFAILRIPMEHLANLTLLYFGMPEVIEDESSRNSTLEDRVTVFEVFADKEKQRMSEQFPQLNEMVGETKMKGNVRRWNASQRNLRIRFKADGKKLPGNNWHDLKSEDLLNEMWRILPERLVPQSLMEFKNYLSLMYSHQSKIIHASAMSNARFRGSDNQGATYQIKGQQEFLAG